MVMQEARRRAKWVILLAVGLFAIMLVVAIWLAVSVSVDTVVEVDEATGAIHIKGTEVDFVGEVRGTYLDRDVLIEGLPVADELQSEPLAWRAVCAVRDDPQTDWSAAKPIVRVHLHSEQMTQLCRPFA